MDIMIGERYISKLRQPLEHQGLQVFGMPDNPLIDPRLASHADLSMLRLPGKKLVVSKHLGGDRDIVDLLTSRGFGIFFTSSEQGAKYPNDAGLCACLCGDKLIHRADITDVSVLEGFGGERINVKQGYARCAICPVCDDSVITSDDGLAGALRRLGWDVLKIEQGLVQLEGFNYGFIGGASFVAEDSVFFTGVFPEKNAEEIERFIASKKKRIVYLTNGPVFDIGGAVDISP